jgi:pilus assembly protein CpaB
MGKWKTIIPIMLALVIAASGSLFLYKWLQKQSAPKEMVRVETEAVPVTVALVDLTWGTKIQPDMIKTVAFVKECLPPGYVTDPKSLENRVLISQVKKNEPITVSRLAPESVTEGGVSAIVKPGQRAVAVKGDKVIGISGFINPGNRVDVLVTLKHPRTKLEVTKIVLENTLVLATGTQMQENAEGKPSPVDVYTLEVSPEDGEKLGLAASQGTLQFALRNNTDSETVLTKGATIAKTLLSYSHPKPTAKTKWRPTSATVEVIKGEKVSKKKMNL